METAMATTSVRDQIALAQALAKSDIIPEAYRGRPANIVVATQFGASMGLSPAESLYRINVIKGKPTMSAELIAAQVRRAGHRLRLRKDEASQSVTCSIVRRDDPECPIEVTRDAAWAERMGLSGQPNYRKQPMTMLTWRAITACAREACPEALYGVAYTPDEMHDMDAPAPVAVTPAEAPTVEPPSPDGGGMARVRELWGDYVAARGGIAPEQAAAELAHMAGVASMSDDVTDEQAARAVEGMERTIRAWRSVDGGGGEPELLPDEVEF